jgi:prolyl-tRNA editing enzyme YbaK/EbsC (Cys-tRNA(Pro) deacylase)
MIPEKVRKVLDAHGLRAIEFEKGSTATSVMAAGKLGVAVGQIAKSLLFIGKDGRRFLLIAPGDRKVSSSKLKAACGVKIHMADAEETLAATGFAVGGVCPFGIGDGIAVLIDRSLSRYQTVYPAAGNDASGVPMSYAQLVAVTGGREGDYLADADAGT